MASIAQSVARKRDSDEGISMTKILAPGGGFGNVFNEEEDYLIYKGGEIMQFYPREHRGMYTYHLFKSPAISPLYLHVGK